MVVVYKVDRLTRALSDFAKMVEIFDGAGVSFVSVTQAFNTTSSMGRLTLNVLLSFAQFEREVTAERIRDKVAASKRKGMWMGGAVPMGYDAKDKALVVNETEAEAVRTIFREYLALGSVPALRKRLAALGIVSKRRTDRHGRVSGGGAFSTGALYHLLRNPVYAGKVKHGGALHEGQHDAIVDPATWQRVQELSRRQRRRHRSPVGGDLPRAGSMDGSSTGMADRCAPPTRHVRSPPDRSASRSATGTMSRSPKALRTRRPRDRLPAGPLEGIVREAIARQLADRAWVADCLAAGGAHPDDLAQALARAEDIAAQGTPRNEDAQDQPLTTLAHRIELGDGSLKITCDLGSLLDAATPGSILAPAFAVPMSLHRKGRNRPIVLQTDTGAPRRDADLIALVADARRWMDELLEGRARSVAEITEREQLRPGAVSRILPLAWLAPDIATASLKAVSRPA